MEAVYTSKIAEIKKKGFGYFKESTCNGAISRISQPRCIQ